MPEVVLIADCLNVANTLRRIADDIDAGVYAGKSATLILDTALFHLGAASVHSDTAVREVVWDCTWALHAVMARAHL